MSTMKSVCMGVVIQVYSSPIRFLSDRYREQKRIFADKKSDRGSKIEMLVTAEIKDVVRRIKALYCPKNQKQISKGRGAAPSSFRNDDLDL